MAEYSDGTYRKNPKTGKWQGLIRYRDTPGEPWRAKTRVFDIPCKDSSNVGEARARAAFKEWRAQFVAAHERELEEAERGARLEARTVAEYLEGYIDSLETLGRQDSTIAGYRRMLAYVRHGAPLSDSSAEEAQPVTIGQVALEDLTREAVQAWVNDMAERLAPVTVKKALTVLRAALRDACRDERIDRNPAEIENPPAMRKAPQNPLDERQQQALLADLNAYTAAHPEDPSRLAIKTALLTGMRQGEICALTWADVDLEGETLTVRRSIGRRGDSFRSGNGSYYVKEPKNGGSRRTIPLPPTLAADLRARRARMAEECMEAGVRLGPSMYVFGSVDGSFMNPHGLWVKWKRIAKRLGLTGLDGSAPKFHDLRHTFATTAIAHGMDVKTLSSILGHANAAMTLNVYASADPDAKRAAMERMGALYGRMEAEGTHEADVMELGRTGTEDA